MALSDHPMWQKPTHHSDVTDKNDHVHWIELFYDLIHVVTIFLLGNQLSHHLSFGGFAEFTALFILFWVTWGDFAYYNSLYVSRDFKHRIIMSFHICTVLVMAASIPSLHDGGLVYLVSAYAMNRLFMSLFYFRARRHDAKESTLATEFSRNFLITAIVSGFSILLPSPYSIYMFIGGIAFLQLSYIAPKVGVMRFPRFTPRSKHLAERFSLFLLICLGEGFFKLAVSLSEKGIQNASPEVFFHYILSGAGIFILAWMYFDYVGNKTSVSQTKGDSIKWWYGHMFLMLSAVMIGVALKAEVKIGFMDEYPLGYGLVGCAGLILYISSLWVIHSSINDTIGNKLVTPGVRIFGIVCALLTFATVIFDIPSIVGNLLFFLAITSQLFIPITRAYYKFR